RRRGDEHERPDRAQHQLLQDPDGLRLGPGGDLPHPGDGPADERPRAPRRPHPRHAQPRAGRSLRVLRGGVAEAARPRAARPAPRTELRRPGKPAPARFVAGGLMKHLIVALLLSAGSAATAQEPKMVEIPVDELEDKIRGGLIGQILGNLNGLPHEFKYIAESGNVETYAPGLPKGAWMDDDMDIEWVYLAEMQRTGKFSISPKRIAELWRANMNSGIWCANLYARHLLDLGLEPPLTGMIAFNPWSEFNISAQFVSEAFGLIAPGMPEAAATIGVYYTSFAVDAEPLQTDRKSVV